MSNSAKFDFWSFLKNLIAIQLLFGFLLGGAIVWVEDIFGWVLPDYLLRPGSIAIGGAVILALSASISIWLMRDDARSEQNAQASSATEADQANTGKSITANLENTRDAKYEMLSQRIAQGQCLKCGSDADPVNLAYGISLVDSTSQYHGNATVETGGRAFQPLGEIGVPYCENCLEKDVVEEAKSGKRFYFFLGFLFLIIAALCGYFLFPLDPYDADSEVSGPGLVLGLGMVMSGCCALMAWIEVGNTDIKRFETAEGRTKAFEAHVRDVFRSKLKPYLDRYFPTSDPHFLVYPDARYRFDSRSLDSFSETWRDENGKILERQFIDHAFGPSSAWTKITYSMDVMTLDEVRR